MSSNPSLVAAYSSALPQSSPPAQSTMMSSIMSEIRFHNTTIASPATENDNKTATTKTSTTANGSTSAISSPTPAPPGASTISFLSPSTEEILKRVTARHASLGAGAAGWEAAREQVLKNMRTSDSIATTANDISSTTGRGRGRGRGRVRGGVVKMKNGNASTTLQVPPIGAAPASTSPGRGRGGGRPRGRGRGGRRLGKRKRNDEEEEESFNDDDDSDDSASYTPAQTTKSGRNVNKPAAYVPVIPSSAQASNKRRKTSARAPNARSVCKTCQRGHSPNANMIVFCDNCNAGYHQYCHHPPIEKDVVLVPDKEWICANCTKDRGTEQATVGDMQPDFPPDELVPGDQWTEKEKRAYFNSLSHQALVALCMHSSSKYFSRLLPSDHPPPTAAGPAPVANGIHDEDAKSAGGNRSNDDFVDDDPPAHYPRPGFGLARNLPPESEHLQRLVDDNPDVFSHVFPAEEEARALAAAAAAPAADTNGASTMNQAFHQALHEHEGDVAQELRKDVDAEDAPKTAEESAYDARRASLVTELTGHGPDGSGHLDEEGTDGNNALLYGT